MRATGAANTGLALSWSSRTAGRYVITQATNAAMTAGVRIHYSITSQAHRFTPLRPPRRAARYYFQVRAYNGSRRLIPVCPRRQLARPGAGARTCG